MPVLGEQLSHDPIRGHDIQECDTQTETKSFGQSMTQDVADD